MKLLKAAETILHQRFREDDFDMPDYALMNQCLFEGKAKEVEQMTKDALAEGRPVQEVLSEGLIAGMSVVGEDFKYNIPLFSFLGHTDVKELAMYVQDNITKRNWTFNLGIRGDFYNGLTVARQAEPRLGVSYNVQKTNTILRVSYARTLETPFNENLVLFSTGCNSPVIAAIVPCVPAPLTPGFRNEFHAGFQQAFGRFLVLDGEYIWKYTHTGYDFSIFGNTPIFFPIGWHNSKIPGWALRASVPVYHGFSALVVMS